MSPDSPRLTHREVLRLAVPIVLSNVSTPLLGLVATAAVGHLDDQRHLGGVAIGSLIFTFLYWSFSFLRMGTTGFTAQAAGAGDAAEVKLVMARAGLIGLAIGLVLLALQVPVGRAAVTLAGASEGVGALAFDYFQGRIWGAPGALVGYAVLGWFIGRSDTRTALILQVVMNALNAALCILFVTELGLGAGGVGLASAIAELAAAALGVVLVFRATGRLGGQVDRAGLLDAGALLRLLAVNRDIFLRTLFMILAFAWFTTEAAKLGDTLLAANAVLMNFVSFAAFGLDGFAHAAEVLVGRAIGAGAPGATRRAIRLSAIWSAGIALAFTLVYGAFGVPLIDALTSLPAVREAAYAHLPWLVVMPLVAVSGYLLDGVFIGALRGPEMRNAMAASLLAFGVAQWMAVPPLGLHGLWFAFLIWMLARTVCLSFYLPRILRG